MSHPTSGPHPGFGHLTWIARFQWSLLALGVPLWLCRSWRASAAFLLGGLLSVSSWHLHRIFVSKMLTPSVRLRWMYGLLGLLKLALLVSGAHAIMACLPAERIPLVVGILIFVGGILLEAGRLIVRPDSTSDDPELGN